MTLRGGSLRATASSVRFKDVIRRTAFTEKMLTAEKAPQSSIDKAEVPKTLQTSIAKLQVCEGSAKDGKEDKQINKPVRSSLRNPPPELEPEPEPEPEHKPPNPHQAAGARPKSGRPLRRSSSVTSEEWRRAEVTESQTEKTKTLPREQRADSKQTRAVNRALSPPCLYCKGGHPFKECVQFAKHPHDLKLEVLKKAGLCFACLGEAHFPKSCHSRLRCPFCFRDHPKILHIQSLDEWIKELFKENKELTVGKLFNMRRSCDLV